MNLNARFAEAVADQLARCGVTDAVIAPGSRSAPLALALAARLRAHVVLDERSAAFVALGAAKATARPAVVLATSGSAGAHFYPALLEAEATGVPLIALTADRPPELHGFGAPQQLDQQHLFGRHVRFYADLGLPEASFRHARALVARACAAEGPAHLNAPFREPLAPVPQPLPEIDDAPAAPVATAAPATQLPPIRGTCLVVEGPRDGERLGTLPAYADLILRSDEWARALRPDTVVRVGGNLCSKIVQAWVESVPRQIVVQDRGEPVDPGHRATEMVRGDAARLLRDARFEAPPLWAEAERRAGAALEAIFAREPWCEPFVARETARAAEQLYVASSMPVRDVDAFAPRGPRLLQNRGLNGIDGIVSSAAGAALATGRPTVALVGDVALLHDLGGLVAAARLGAPLTVVCVNNDGGGIFSFLPIAQHTERFEQLFGTPHGCDLAGAAQLAGLRFARCENAAALRAALRSGAQLIEARTDRARNVEQHRALQAQVLAALGDPP